MLRRSTFRALCIMTTCCALLAGCVQIDEWTSVATTGVTTVHTLVRVAIGKSKTPKAALSDNPFENAQALEKDGITVVEHSSTMQHGQMLMHIVLQAPALRAFAHIADLIADSKAAPPTDPTTPDVMKAMRESTFFQVRAKGNRLHIERRFAQTKVKTPAVAKTHAKHHGKKSGLEDLFGGGDVADMMLGGFNLRYGIALPSAVLASNADLVDGNIAQWAFPVTAMQHEKITLWVEVANTPENRAALLK